MTKVVYFYGTRFFVKPQELSYVFLSYWFGLSPLRAHAGLGCAVVSFLFCFVLFLVFDRKLVILLRLR